jgi:hypothetical protein
MGVVIVSWKALDEELARWRDAGSAPELWWRDDDAALPTPAFSQMLASSSAAGVPLALAVVPLGAVPELFAGLKARVLMHGTDHRNRAGAAGKKTEFAAAEPVEEALGRLRAARERLLRLAGANFLPVLAPPWNRIGTALAARLPEAGLHGLSAYGARAAAQTLSGVRQVNTHVDLIDWRGTRRFIGEEAALSAAAAHLAARRTGAADAAEPTGVLSHHALHEAAAWAFLERFFERTRAHGARWADAAALFPRPP